MKYSEDELKDIPRYLYSYVDEKPFSNCIECEKFLLDGETEYLIERICKNYPDYTATDIVFDYAICMECAMRMHSKMSKHSQKVLQEYFVNNMDIEGRKEQINNNVSIDDSLAKCIVSGDSASDCKEYQVCAHCVGNQVYMGNPPYMLSGVVLEEIMNILSNETQDIMNGFYNKHRPPVPGLHEPDPVLILV